VIAAERLIPARGARLFVREIGTGPPVVVLHGGPDFDHRYLLPELDRLSDVARLIYYDQRGRGRSADGVEPDSVTIESEIDDLETIRESLGFGRVALLGHSWGGLLAAEYAVRHPQRVSHLVMMNSAPFSFEERERLRMDRQRNPGTDLEGMKAIAATPLFRAGDIAAEAEYYRLHFRTALRRPEDVERIVSRLRIGFNREGILKARAIEDRLYRQTWNSSAYDLSPALGRLEAPTLVIHGAQDLVPVSCAENLARAVPGARLEILEDCGHFAYLEQPGRVHEAIAELLLQARVR